MDETRDQDIDVAEALRHFADGQFGDNSYAKEWLNIVADRVDSEYIRLPLDADGVPIRLGDDMEWTNRLNGSKERFTCMGYTTEYSTFTPDSYTLMATNEECAEFYCNQCRHAHPDTVESVLEEFYRMARTGEHVENVTIDEYAERIRQCLG